MLSDAAMPLIELRRMCVTVEEIRHEFGPPAARPPRRGSICAVLRNPYAGGYVPDIQPMMEELKPVGIEMAQRLLSALGGEASGIEGFGKGAIVGTGGEIEHGALWHAPGGYGMREVLRGARAIVPSTKKVGGPGARLDIPVTHVNASYVRSHFDSMEVGVPGAPARDELVLALVMTTGPRVHARVGGLKAEEIAGKDGLR